GFQTLLLILAELFRPDSNHLLQLRANQETERSILAGSLVIRCANLIFQTVTESLAEVGKLLLISESAESSHDLLPVGQVSVVHNIPEVLSNDRCKQADVVRTVSLLRE